MKRPSVQQALKRFAEQHKRLCDERPLEEIVADLTGELLRFHNTPKATMLVFACGVARVSFIGTTDKMSCSFRDT